MVYSIIHHSVFQHCIHESHLFKPCKLTDLQKEICEGVSVSKGSFFPAKLMQRTFNEIKQILESAWILHSMPVYKNIFSDDCFLSCFQVLTTSSVRTNCLIKKKCLPLVSRSKKAFACRS